MPNRSLLLVTMSASLVVAGSGRAIAQPVRISVATDGTSADGPSRSPSLSADGRFVAFISDAANLVADDTNGYSDLFVRDRDTDADGVFDESGAVSTVRVQRPGIQPNGVSMEPRITPDGRYVVFVSSASSLFADPSNGPLAYRQVFRWDRLTGEIVFVSRNAQGDGLNSFTYTPVVTADGNTVYFVSDASNDGGGDPGPGRLVFRRRIAEATLERVSDPIPAASAGSLFAESPTVSDDGGVFAYAVAVIGLGRYGGTTYVHRAGQPIRTYSGIFPQLSGDGQFLTLIASQARQIHLPSEQISSVCRIAFPMSNAPSAMSRSGRYLSCECGLVDFVYGSAIGGGTEFASDLLVAYTVTDFEPMRTIADIVVRPLAEQIDNDHDGLNDHWETAFGLSTTPGTGAIGSHGPNGDMDMDGLTNAQEQARGSNPWDTAGRYLAEGSSGAFFTTRYAIANPGIGVMIAAVRLETADGDVVSRVVTLPPRTRVTLDSRALGLGTASFSAVVEPSSPAVVDRLMTWGDPAAVPYGSHAETASPAPATSWFLAEGSTVLGFQLFYLLQNPQSSATTATIRFLLPSGSPVVRSYQLGPRSRTTIYVNSIPGLGSTDVSAEITAAQPIAVERAMYRSSGGQTFALGHAAAAVAATATTWNFAEGATGAFFDTYLLLANPSTQPASVQVQYLRDTGGPVSRTYPVPAGSRASVFVDGEPGLGATSFGMRVTSTVPIVAERAMYWAGGFFDYYEGHVSAGATQTGSRWVLAESEQGGPYDAQSFVLIANTGATPASVACLLYTSPSPRD